MTSINTCKYCEYSGSYVKVKSHETYCLQNPVGLSNRNRNSISRSKYLLANPSEHPYVKYHKHKGPSPAELYFIECFKKYAIEYDYPAPNSNYIIDFINLTNKNA